MRPIGVDLSFVYRESKQDLLDVDKEQVASALSEAIPSALALSCFLKADRACTTLGAYTETHSLPSL